jgi:hypothetical protein
MLIRLTQRLAQCIDGVDLSNRSVNEVFDLPQREAELLIAEGWALREDSAQPVGQQSAGTEVGTGTDRSAPTTPIAPNAKR